MKTQSVLEALRSFQSSLKTASVTDSVPDGTTTPKEGERSKENSADVKAAVPSNVESAPVAGSGVNNTSATNAGDPTGVNVPSAKTTKEDPGTSHPAKAGPMSGGATKSASALANDILADIAAAMKAENTKTAAETPVAPTTPATPAAPATTAAPVADNDEALGFAVGTKLAQDLTGDSELTKLAAEYLGQRLDAGPDDASTTKLATAVVSAAVEDAVRVFQYLNTKMAGDVMPPPDAAGAGGPPVAPPDAAGAGGPPPAAGGGAPVDPQAAEIAQALLSGELTLQDLVQALSGGGEPAGGGEAPPPTDKKGPEAAGVGSTEHVESDKTASTQKLASGFLKALAVHLKK